jgi:hypothetical protein
MPAITTPITIPNNGYGPVDLAGDVPAATYRVYVGPTGTVADPQVYNGIPGSGGFLIQFAIVSPGVTAPTKPVFLPPLPIGGPYTITLVDGMTTIVTDPAVTVVPAQFSTGTSNLRRVLPQNYATGPRTVLMVKFPQD